MNFNHKDDIIFDAVLGDVYGSTQYQIFQRLAKEAAAFVNMDDDHFLNILMKAEAQSPAGIGGGVALPEVQIEGITEPVCIFMKLNKQVDFASLDNTPVDLVCLLLSPRKDGALHLKRLSRLSRLLRDASFCDIVRNIQNIDDIQSLFLEWQREQRLAA